MAGRLVMAVGFGTVLLGSFESPASGTPERLQEVTFSEQTVVLIPPPQPAGLDVSRIFSEWQIILSSESGQSPTSGYRTLLPWEVPPAADSPVLLNGAYSSESGALVITFGRPVWRFAVELGSEGGTDATVRYFSADGRKLGEEVVLVRSRYEVFGAYPVEDAEGRQISRVEVEYESSEEPEALFLLWADFVDPPSFRNCVAQVAHGAIPGTHHTLQTQLSITNSAVHSATKRHSPVAQVQLELLDHFGDASAMLVDGEQANPLDVEITGVRSEIVRTSEIESDLERGYACVTSNYPVELAALYRILDSNNLPVSEAGIQGTAPGYRFFGVFQKERLEGTNTALAVGNVSEERATVLITFRFPLPMLSREVAWTLEPGEQRAEFLHELLPDLSDQDAEGAVEIISDQLIIATSLRTIHSVVSSSLPLGRSPIPTE